MTPLPSPHSFFCQTATGAIYDHGAHVVDWTPAGQQPVLWMSRHTSLDSGQPIRGGIPICWPWFGAGRDGDASPMHGLARLHQWRVVHTEQTPSAVVVTCEWAGNGFKGFEQPFRLNYEVGFGAEFSATLTVTNSGAHPFTFEEALHTYLNVGDISGVTIDGLAGASYVDRAPEQDAGPHRQSGVLRIESETDRIYSQTDDIVVIDDSLKRRITVSRTGSENVVIWNPWIAKSHAMPDFGDDEWQTMLCVETCNVLRNAVTLNPGENHSMGFSLRVS